MSLVRSRVDHSARDLAHPSVLWDAGLARHSVPRTAGMCTPPRSVSWRVATSASWVHKMVDYSARRSAQSWDGLESS